MTNRTIYRSSMEKVYYIPDAKGRRKKGQKYHLYPDCVFLAASAKTHCARFLPHLFHEEVCQRCKARMDEED